MTRSNTTYAEAMAPRSFLFVHSPLVGPSSLKRLAAAATSAGHEVALPDLTPIARAEYPQLRFVQLATEAARALTTPVIVVGHSGAGVFLPKIGSIIEDLGGLVFVDAVLPPREDPHRTPEGMKTLLDEQTVDGILRPWLDWWPAEVVADILPVPGDRAELASDMPQLPRSFYEIEVDVPHGWSTASCGYIQLSPAYVQETQEAIVRGWPSLPLDSTHLGPHTEPNLVLDALLRIIDQIR